jgi:Uncharacterized alpha/beta hydrolase domain (DUF2235)
LELWRVIHLSPSRRGCAPFIEPKLALFSLWTITSVTQANLTLQGCHDVPEALAIAKSAQKKRLAVFLDGTWNVVGDNTNVWRMRSLCAPTGTDDAVQLTYYEKGDYGFVGGLFGKGLDRDITDAYQWLIEHYNQLPSLPFRRNGPEPAWSFP